MNPRTLNFGGSPHRKFLPPQKTHFFYIDEENKLAKGMGVEEKNSGDPRSYWEGRSKQGNIGNGLRRVGLFGKPGLAMAKLADPLKGWV